MLTWCFCHHSFCLLYSTLKILPHFVKYISFFKTIKKARKLNANTEEPLNQPDIFILVGTMYGCSWIVSPPLLHLHSKTVIVKWCILTSGNRPKFLSLNTVDIFNQTVLCWGGCFPVHNKVFNLYSPDASNPSHDNQKYFQIYGWGKNMQDESSTSHRCWKKWKLPKHMHTKPMMGAHPGNTGASEELPVAKTGTVWATLYCNPKCKISIHEFTLI